MKKNKKLDLKELQVKSFVTNVDEGSGKTVNGGLQLFSFYWWLCSRGCTNTCPDSMPQIECFTAAGTSC